MRADWLAGAVGWGASGIGAVTILRWVMRRWRLAHGVVGERGGAVVVADVAAKSTVRAVRSGDVACWFPGVTRCAMWEFWCPCVRFVGSWCSEGIVRVMAGEFSGSGAWVLGDDGLGV